MAKNDMTPEQDLATRVFYTLVVSDDALFPSQVVDQRAAARTCLRLLGYIVVGDSHVAIDKVDGSGFKYGTEPAFDDEWEEDTRRVENEVNKTTNKNKANSSKSPENPPLWKALLSKDV